ncbi:MAG TPA: DNA polymerase III subunit beta [Phycisphaerales bacterium]|jgi:DNA polymerase-3 subunit beta|nr:DNA polymerase III subunit beta [Phycisphaerales bacterium]
MKVICDRGALLDAVNLVAAVVPSRSPTPALSCVKLVATKGPGQPGLLTLSATDAETSLHIALSAVDVQKPGQVAVPADKLRAIIAAEDGEATLTLETDGGTAELCHIKGQNAHFRVFGFPAADFPPMPDFAATVAGAAGAEPAKSVFSQQAGTLLDLVSKTIFATARETSRYAINGVMLKREGKKLEMVATDGRRLALCKSNITGATKDSAGGAVTCIVPTKALNILAKLVRDDEDIVRIAVTDSRIFFAFEDAVSSAAGKGEKGDKAGGAGGGSPRAVLTSSLVEGTFPPYEDVIPRDQDKKITASRDLLGSAVRKAAVLTNEESRGVRMSFSKDNKQLKLSSRAPEMGESEISVDLEGYEGEDIEISFNPTFIADVLKVVPDPEVIVELKAPNKPGLIKTPGGEFVYVVMPVNLPG